jgi:hypothetical protein
MPFHPEISKVVLPSLTVKNPQAFYSLKLIYCNPVFKFPNLASHRSLRYVVHARHCAHPALVLERGEGEGDGLQVEGSGGKSRN